MMTPPVAYSMTAQRPMSPPADIPLGIMKHSHAIVTISTATVISR